MTSLHSAIYVLDTNMGEFKFNDIELTVEFSGSTYKVYNYENGNTLKLYCENILDKILFEIYSHNNEATLIVYTQEKSVSETKLLIWEGVGNYDLNNIVATSIKNREGYLQHQNWGNKRAEGFNTALDFLVEKLKSGKIRRKSNGSFEIIGGGAESTGKYDRNFFGGIKNNTNTAYTDASSYLATVLDALGTYIPPSTLSWKQIHRLSIISSRIE